MDVCSVLSKRWNRYHFPFTLTQNRQPISHTDIYGGRWNCRRHYRKRVTTRRTTHTLTDTKCGVKTNELVAKTISPHSPPSFTGNQRKFIFKSFNSITECDKISFWLRFYYYYCGASISNSFIGMVNFISVLIYLFEFRLYLYAER